MILIKLSKADGEGIRVAAESLGKNSDTKNSAEKAVDAAKKLINLKLIELRKIDPSQLDEKEVVMVQVESGPDGRFVDVLKIERKGASRLDGPGLSHAHPDIAAEFTKRGVASYYSSLIK